MYQNKYRAKLEIYKYDNVFFQENVWFTLNNDWKLK